MNERKEDIPLLAEHFNKQICAEHGIPTKEINDSAIKEFQKINWSGNIREFRNVLERLIILCDKEIKSDDVKLYAQPMG